MHNSQYSVGGNIVNTPGMPIAMLPGNFGVRVMDSLVRCNDLSQIFKERKSMQANSFTSEQQYDDTFAVPNMLERPDFQDYLSEEESDSAPTQDMKIPELSELLMEFEKDDEAIGELKKIN